jgi:peroxiredoxin
MDNAIFWIIGIVVVAGLVFALRKKARGRPVPEILKPGQPLPDFQAIDEDGNRVGSSDLSGAPAILLFVRGSWCPFCSKQVASLTKVYKEITDSGAKLILITPKPLDTTRRVANIFGVDFQFWLDDSLEIAKQLGLVLEAGVPDDQRKEYGEDTRPNPEKLLKVLRTL